MSNLEILLTIFILALITIFGVFVWFKWPKENIKFKLMAIILCFSIFVCIYSIQFLLVVPNIKVVGLHTTVRKLNENQKALEIRHKELTVIATTLIKMNYLVLSSDITILRSKREKLMNKYTATLYKYIDPKEIEELKLDLIELGKK